MKERTFRLQDLLGLLHRLYPPALAESWDNVGLQAGDPSASVSRVLVCLDVSEYALDEAQRIGAEAIVSHHPLIFQPLKHLSPMNETGRLLFRAVREGVAIVSAHTNLDCAKNGLNDWLAASLGLEKPVPLQTGATDLHKLVVFVPSGYEDRVAKALFEAGAGTIGDYDSCSFRTDGVGTFRPGDDTRPFIGQSGALERVREIRMETILTREVQARAVQRMLKAHPYEEVAYDLIPLANRRSDVGLGRIGRLAQTTTLGAFADTVKRALDIPHVRVVGELDRKVGKVAVCGGSGASLLGDTDRMGADVLVTGDVKYHEALSARDRNIGLIDAGHFGTEHIMVKHLAEVLRQAAAAKRMGIQVEELKGEQDPFLMV
ncbi:dimetal-binding protein YqfO [Syntrophotalea carbinolica DSM 2380]|uniref:GTP cyclohydrolase 1 type 2 homolog n=1 Tax=Syntrophotalea carbinolica (strain DSM 2380 / NBRC 103641 / GraBd1) TaxID=338963 RepID=Q3A144_SYNC1|nr:Nif3-like dinuclear metal center hexameric protein [Syntrophotalea carbinolica]ABA89913.1 dimetal-binding protein YqfO [Syntrophotalea carbinolica DSM 2380]